MVLEKVGKYHLDRVCEEMKKYCIELRRRETYNKKNEG